MFDRTFDLDLLGFSIVPDLLNSEEVSNLLAALSEIKSSASVHKRSSVYAVRNLLDAAPAVAALASSQKVMSLAQAALGPGAIPVRATLFDKTVDANWLVPWHQDVTICVKKRVESEGYGPWTVKSGIHHVQAPESVLENMLAIRIHLDDTHASNGALRVLPATHRCGRLSDEQIELDQENITPVTCSISRGGALLMKPLLLHASSASSKPSHRRVIHIDFAACQLPAGMHWLTETETPIA
jgi:ectoine hydroxylase-related dioxygenase (phytanoyl-CoA dioxygenase family)